MNFWVVDTFMVHVPHARRDRWQDALMPLVSAWAGGVALEPTDIYGLREYRDGAVLFPHVDREDTHALSLIVNVAQAGVRAPWPVVITNFTSGAEAHVTLEPGELLYYESAKCVHGRTVPLEGEYYVNLFSHYRPDGQPHWWKEANPAPSDDSGACGGDRETCDASYDAALAALVSGEDEGDASQGLPS